MEDPSPWLPTRNAKYGVVVYDYTPDKPYPYLPLRFGEVVHILEENGGWYRGYALRNKNSKGVFPSSHIHLKECTVDNPGPSEVIVPKEDAMVQDVSDVLREWCHVWKRLYADGRRQQFSELGMLLKELLDKRRQIMSKTLPRDELKELKQKVAAKIEYGNRFSGLDIIPREESGVMMNPKTSGVMKLFKAIRTMSANAESATQPQAGGGSHTGQLKVTRSAAPPSAPKKEEHHLFLKFSALALPVNEPCDLLFFIYDGKQNKILSERYMISLSQQCLPKNPDKINQCYALFTDLDTQDLQNKDLYLACQVIRVGNELDGNRTASPLRKPHCAGLYPIHELLNTKEQLQEEIEPQVDLFMCPPAEYHRLLENIVKKQGVYHQTDKGTGVFVGVRVLRGPLSKVKEDNPLLFRKFTAIVKKYTFAEIIRPYDERHDVYLTLSHGIFNKGNKRSDKNVQVDVEIIGDDYNAVQKCISPGIGEDNVTMYGSLVHYHLATPIFNETIKIKLSPEEMKNARVRFSFYHKSTKMSSKLGKSEMFALSHLKLMKGDSTMIADGQHDLYVYNYKDMHKQTNKLFKMPDVVSSTLVSPPDHLHLKDTFTVLTKTCSTKLTQDAGLHGLLHWRSNEKKLKSILEGLQHVSGNEIVKFLAGTFNALFQIIEEKGEEFGNEVFDALVLIIGLLIVEKFENFRPVLDTYCEQHFSAASIHTFLVKKMKFVFEQVMLMEGGRRTLDGQTINRTMKAAEFLFKFVMRSRHLYDQATHGKGNDQFIQSLLELLRVTGRMMAMECPQGELVAPKAQAQAMQFFPQIFDLLLESISVKSLAEVVAEFLRTIKETKLKVHKSAFIAAVVSSKLFTHKESRGIILPSTLRHLKYHISQRDEVAIQRDDALEKSLEILGSILIHLHSLPPGGRDADIRILIKEMLLVLLDCFRDLSNLKDRIHPQLRLCVSIIMSLTELMTPEHYRWYRSTFDIKQELEELVQSTFHTYSEFISLVNLYPSDWCTLKLAHNHVMLTAIQRLAQILIEEFLGDPDSTTSVYFNYNLWEKFFELTVDFCCQPSIQLESLTEFKTTRIMDLYGDMRYTMNKLMLDKWNTLGNFQSRFVPGMIGPFLKVSLLPNQALRKATIPIFFDMMEYEWKFKKNFHLMEIEMIDKLDLYVSSGVGDPEYRKILYSMLSDKCKSHPAMAEGGGIKFVESLAELLKRLLDYRAVPRGGGSRDLHMHVVFNLLNFYKSIGREEIYLRYIYRLAELHKDSHNWVEAAFTLLLHAQLLQWSPVTLKEEGPYERQSAADRKMTLYNDIIHYLDKGKLWECGIQECKEIASQLESVTFDYEQLSRIHQTISRFYTSILREVRAEPMYFRVGFYGNFPSFLKNKVFIYRGQEFEKLQEFNQRLAANFPAAKFLTSLKPPGFEIMESEDTYIQSCSVEPIPEQSIVKKFEGKQVNEVITRFYHTNYVRHFVLKRPFHEGTKDKKNEYKTLHIERTIYTTEYQFPGILRWFEIVEDPVVTTINPVENGSDLIEDNINQLRIIMTRVRGDRQNTNPLTMKLNGTLDAAVNGGVSNFDAFFTHEYLTEHPDYKASIPRLRKLMEELGKICTEAVAFHSEVCPDSMKALHEEMEKRLQEYLSKYGDRSDESAYDPSQYLDPGIPKKRLSSSRRRRPPSGTFERTQTVSTSSLLHDEPPPPVPEHRNRAHTESGFLEKSSSRKPEPDYEEPPRIPTKQRRQSIQSNTPPPMADQPPVPVRKGNRTPSGSPNRSRPTSFTGSGDNIPIDDSPRPPPRVASVRTLGLGRSISHGSRESLDQLTDSTIPPSQQSVDVTPQRNVRELVEKLAQEEAPPPVPLKKLQKQQSTQLLKTSNES